MCSTALGAVQTALPFPLSRLAGARGVGEVRAGLSDTCKWKWDPTWKTNAPESGGGEGEEESRGGEKTSIISTVRASLPPSLPPPLLQVRPNQKWSPTGRAAVRGRSRPRRGESARSRGPLPPTAHTPGCRLFFLPGTSPRPARRPCQVSAASLLPLIHSGPLSTTSFAPVITRSYSFRMPPPPHTCLGSPTLSSCRWLLKRLL